MFVMEVPTSNECGDPHNNSDNNLLESVRKSSPSPFLLKTYMLVEDPNTDEIVSWNADGTAFVVWQPAEFARDLLPTLFKHSNFSSFVRQLNTYGFRKIATSRWEFCNDKFKKGERDLLTQIRRRKAWSNKPNQPPPNNQNPTTQTQMVKEPENCEDQRSSSTSSSSGYSTLMDENKRLKKENGVLCSELCTMKRKCQELLDLVAIYSSNNEEKEDERPKLFGVRLEVEGERKRKTSLLVSHSCK